MPSNVRARQAAQTKREIVAAARRLIAAQGYQATTIEQIAAGAGVAVPTVYKAFGTKRAIALALNELIDSEAGMPELVPRALAETTGPGLIAASVRIGRSLFEHSGDLIAMVDAVAAGEPELAAVRAEGQRRLVEGVRATVRRLDELGALADGLNVTHGAGLLGQLSSAETFLALTEHHHWTPAQCERWLTEAACRLLLRTPE